MTPRDGVNGSLYLQKYNEPLTPSQGVILLHQNIVDKCN